jgi:hypothetical protein
MPRRFFYLLAVLCCMGGRITAAILATHPERLITASFGGSGIRETDPEWIKRILKDPVGGDPQEDEAARNLRIRNLMDYGRTREQAIAELFRVTQRPAVAATPATRTSLDIDLRKVYMPKQYVEALVRFIDANDVP